MNIQDIIAKVEKLPPAPAVLPKLLNLLNDMNSDPADIVTLIKVDPSLMAQVLRLSNSAFYGMATPSADIDEAVGRMGFREVYKLVALVCSKELLGGNIEELFLKEGELWEHSLACGFAMEYIAGKLRMDPSNAYTIGLLHSIGKLIIIAIEGYDYSKVFKLVEEKTIPLEQAEQELFGFTTDELGCALLEKWSFTPDVCIPIRYQSRPSQADSETKTTAMLHLSIWIVASLGKNYGKDAWAMEMDPKALEMLNITEEDIESYIPFIFEKLNSIKALTR